jgi:hypothetical protein
VEQVKDIAKAAPVIPSSENYNFANPNQVLRFGGEAFRKVMPTKKFESPPRK